MVTKLQQYITERTILKTNTGCWEWQMCKTEKGYGKCTYRYKPWKAHRLSYTAFKGEIPEGMHILHACDNPSCCNPGHLRVGTQQDNMEDMRNRGRENKAKGAKNGRSKLNERKVRIIKHLLGTGVPCTKIARLFGVHSTQIYFIKNGTTWSHV